MKTATLISAVLLGLSAMLFASNESSELATTYSDPGKFYGIIVNTNANVILCQGDHNSIKMEGSKRDLKEVHTEVENGALVINGDNNHPVNIYISVEDISLVEINGSAKLYAMGNINSDILLLKVNGSGSMKLDIRTLAIGMIVKGSGKIIVSGSTGDSHIRVCGSGNVYTNDLDSFKSTEERTVLNDSGNNSKRSTLKLHQ